MLEKKKILIIADYSALYAGNFISSLLNFAAIVDENKEYKVIFAFPNITKGRYWVSQISLNYQVCFFEKENNKQEIKSMASLIKNIKPGIVYFHFISDFLCFAVSRRFKKINFFSHIHSDFNANKKISFKQKIKKLLFEKILNRKNTFIYVSRAMYNSSGHAKKYFVLNGLSITRLIDQNFDAKSFLKEHNLHGKYIFLTYGWSPYIKGIDIVLKAFNIVVKKDSNFYLIISCGREIDREKMKEFALKYIESLKNIIFIQPVSDVFGLLSIVNCFISGSRSEGFSYSILEALYSNKRVISSDIEGTKWCGVYKNVKLFKSEDEVDLAEKMFDSAIDNVENINKNDFKKFEIANWSLEVYKIVFNKI